MNLLIRSVVIGCVVFVSTTSGFAKLRLPAVFADHMVLQQLDTVRVWGWAKAEQAVQIVVPWLASPLETRSNSQGSWELEIPTCKAGGPYELLIITELDTIILRDVLLGEVWLCSGQSNMVWGASFGHEEMLNELPNAYRPMIRLFHVARNQAEVPLDTLQGSWQVCDSATAHSFSAIGYFAAKTLNEKLGVPIGIISSSSGGTNVETWTPAQVFEAEPALALLTNHALPVATHWNAMIRPLVGFKIKGVFWYQGEGNVISYQGYGKLLENMVRAWREAWGYVFPFFQVQIAPYAYSSQQVLGNKAAFLREQQLHTLTTIPQTGLVITTDLVPDVNEIHPPKKRDIAKRLSDLALAEVYGHRMIDYKSPIYAGHRVERNHMVIAFDNVIHGLRVMGDRVSHMFIAGNNHVFYPAETTVRGNELIVSSPHVPVPVAVRFGFTDTARPNLFNCSGLPVSPFRTDKWDIP